MQLCEKKSLYRATMIMNKQLINLFKKMFELMSVPYLIMAWAKSIHFEDRQLNSVCLIESRTYLIF